MTAEIRVEDRVEQRGDRTRQPRRCVQGPAIFDEADELAEPLIELADQEAMKPTLFSSGEKNVVRSIMAALRQTDASVNRTLPICQRRMLIAARPAKS